jgi:hypothetical protein
MDVRRADPLREQLGLGAVALRYQQLGYAVLGLAVGSKRPHPAFGHGVSWATRDPAMVPWLWSREKLAGIGIATGQRSQLVIIDLDIKNGDDGPATFAAFLAGNGLQLPPDAMVSSPSGGHHVWLRTPLGQAVPARQGLLPGVDIKGDGGYVAAPPTRVRVDCASGQLLVPYRWAVGCPCRVPPAPQWFCDWTATAAAAGTAHGNGNGSGDPPPDVTELARTGIPVGERNHTLYRLACSLYRRCGTGAAGQQAAREAIDAVLAATDCRGFGRAEIGRTLRSALEFATAAGQADEQAWLAMTGGSTP